MALNFASSLYNGAATGWPRSFTRKHTAQLFFSLLAWFRSSLAVALALKKRHLSSLAYSGWFDIGVIAAFEFGYSCCFSLSFSYFLPITHLIVAITPPPPPSLHLFYF